MESENLFKNRRDKALKDLWQDAKYGELISRTLADYEHLLRANSGGQFPQDEFNARLKSGKVLDVGCGWGGFVDDCRKNGVDAYGVDIALADKTNRSFADKGAVGSVVAADAVGLPFKDGEFHTIINTAGAFSYAHSAEDLKSYIHEQLRLLHRGGKIIINPIEIKDDKFFPMNFVDQFKNEAEASISGGAINELNDSFFEEIKNLENSGTITAEIYDNDEPTDHRSLGRQVQFGVLVIEKR